MSCDWCGEDGIINGYITYTDGSDGIVYKLCKRCLIEIFEGTPDVL